MHRTKIRQVEMVPKSATAANSVEVPKGKGKGHMHSVMSIRSMQNIKIYYMIYVIKSWKRLHV